MFLNFTVCCKSKSAFDSVFIKWLIGLKVAFKILPPYEPTINTFLLIFDWFMAKPLTGIIAPYFFLNNKNPFIGYFNNIFNLWGVAYSEIDALGTYHKSIFPSVPKDKIL